MTLNAVKILGVSGANSIWFVARGDVMRGPYTTEQVNAGLKTKEIHFTDFCWKQGYKEWRPVWAVTDFERRGQLRRLPVYPSMPIPVPVQDEKSTAASAVKAKSAAVRQEKNIKISFAKSPRQAISMYEWALAIILGIGLSYFCTQFALNEVQQGVLAKLQVSLLGRSQSVGHSKHAVRPEVWSPLFSAPGFAEMQKEQEFHSANSTAAPIDLKFSVKVSGHPTFDANKNLSIGGYQIQNSDLVPVWLPSDIGVDPVYSTPITVKGELSADHAQIVATPNGEPYLHVLKQ